MLRFPDKLLVQMFRHIPVLFISNNYCFIGIVMMSETSGDNQ